MRLVLATNNQNKAREIKSIINNPKFEVFTLADLGVDSDPEETGKTFLENAWIKAESALSALKEKGIVGYCVAADDSGLCVDALGGAPGIYSARYAEDEGESGNYKANNKKLLRELKKVPVEERTAHFETAAVMFDENMNKKSAVGQVFGHIAKKPAGHNGFGYDPLFVPEGIALTMAQLSSQEKDEISHRALAFRKLLLEN